MSSDYYGGIAGELADEGAAVERAWHEWFNELTRHECSWTSYDGYRAAFHAGYRLAEAWAGRDAARMACEAYRFAKDQHGGTGNCWCLTQPREETP